MQTGSNGTLLGAGSSTDHELVGLSADIVSAYVGHNTLSVDDLPKLIADVHNALRHLRSNTAPSVPVELKPAVPIKKSIAPDYLICLEDGKKFKSLKRHLRTHYDLSGVPSSSRIGVSRIGPRTQQITFVDSRKRVLD